MVADCNAEQRSIGGVSGDGSVVYGLGGGICPYALNLPYISVSLSISHITAQQ